MNYYCENQASEINQPAAFVANRLYIPASNLFFMNRHTHTACYRGVGHVVTIMLEVGHGTALHVVRIRGMMVLC